MADTSQLYNTELEQGILATLRWDPEINFTIATDGLTNECFTDMNYRRVFMAMKEMTKGGLSIYDDNLLLDAINRTTTENFPRGTPPMDVLQLFNLLAANTSRYTISTNFPHYIHILIDLRNRRRMLEAVQVAMSAIADMTKSADETVESLIKAATDANADTTSSIQCMGEVMTDVVQIAQDNHDGKKPPGVKIGLKRLDQCGGFHPLDLVVIAAESSKGKTTLATTIAMNIAQNYLEQTDCAIAYYSLEMTAQQLVAKMISQQLRISPSRVMFQKLSDSELALLKTTAGKLKTLDNRVFFDQRSVLTVESIIQSIRFLHAKHGVSVVFVDFIQILSMHTSRGLKRSDVVAQAARDFKDLAREIKITIVLISQFNRDKSVGSELSVDRIRESGEINEASDLTLLIDRIDDGLRDYPSPWQDVSTKGTALIKVAKDRFGGYGGVGTFIVGFNAEHSYFYDLDRLPRKEEQPVTTVVTDDEVAWD